MCCNGFINYELIRDQHSDALKKEVEAFIQNLNCNKLKFLLNQVLDTYEMECILDSGRLYYFNKKGNLEKLPDLEVHGINQPRYKIEYFMYTYLKDERIKHSYFWMFNDSA